MEYGSIREDLIARYLNGDCSEAEIEEIKKWLTESRENQKFFFGIKDVWDATAPVSADTEEHLLNFYKARSTKRIPVGSKGWRWPAAIAAALLIGFISGEIIGGHRLSEPPAEIVYSVPLGSKSDLKLPDGTHIYLNSGSILTYSSDYSPKNRNVRLQGEAFFTVTANVQNPFYVSTRDFTTCVTGTQFNVCSYSDDETASVMLVEGKLELSFPDREKNMHLAPGIKAVLDKKEGRIKTIRSDAVYETSWKDGKFIFKNIQFPELVKKLERWYDVKLVVSQAELNQYEYSGIFRNQETIWQVLDALVLTSPVEYRKSNFREFELFYKPKRE
jgi:ferric-dicitrate binding protein FerR (iron transport regulator)